MISLSILIATMPSRKDSFARLLNRLDSQLPMNGSVEILWDDSMEYNIGVKRNKLLDRANGEYIVYIDDDDMVERDYVRKILIAAKDKPDCIGISGIITTDGKNRMQWHISKQYGSWKKNGRTYLRTPNHISPVRKEIALKARFPEIVSGEDYEYSIRILPLLKSESIAKGNIYHYQFKKNK